MEQEHHKQKGLRAAEVGQATKGSQNGKGR